MSRLPIVDTHVHFWDMRSPEPGLQWPWLASDVDHPVFGNMDAMKSVRYGIDSVWAEARFADISGFVHVQAANGSENPVAETMWLTRMRESSPAPFMIVAHADLGTSAAIAQLEGHSRSPHFVGIRDFATEPMLASNQINPLCEASLRWMATRGLVFDVDCEWPNMPALAALAARHPELPIVLEHMGFPRRRDDDYFANWRKGLRAVASIPNVTCKISGAGMSDTRFTTGSLAPWLTECLELFGPERCVTGSNWPFDRLFSSYDVIMDIYRMNVSTLSEHEQELVLSGNARRLYRF